MADLIDKLLERAAYEETIRIAKNLLNLKMPIDTIVTATKLPAEKIKLLKAGLNKE